MPGASWMSREQSTWLSEKMDGFRLSQLQGNVSTYFSEVNAQWFVKWPEAAVHFKDETGIGLTEEQLSKEQHVTLGHHLKQRKAVSVLSRNFIFGRLYQIPATPFLLLLQRLGRRTCSSHTFHQNHYKADGLLHRPHTWTICRGTLHSY